MKKTYALFLGLLCISLTLSAQRPHQPDAAEILLKLKKLNFLGTVLYVAAHPDDENTRLIAYMSNGRLANTAYMAMTRGDGGQNLIGPEIREALGVIRTQELLAARRIDGGKQFFSRANDFGYSKSTEETQEIWDRDKALSDVVWVYRNFKPDVVITRFPPDERAGHGHHTTSAIFAEEAFALAADKGKYPEQLKYVDPWQPKRLYLNTGRWWNPNITGDEKGVLTIDVGAYNPILGESYTEMASQSRSQHKTQGFGSSGRRGEQLEFLEYVKGEQAAHDIFEGIDTSWKRVKGGEAIGKMVGDIISDYDAENPSAIIQPLLTVRKAIAGLQNQYWKKIKLQAVDQLIKDALGLYFEAKADDYSAAPGTSIQVNVEAINRSPISVTLEKVAYDGIKDSVAHTTLHENVDVSFKTQLTIPDDAQYSQPYWLRKEGTLGMYRVDNQQLIGKPENDPAMEVSYTLTIAGQPLTYKAPVVYKWNDPVAGEKYRPFVITPPVFVNIPESVYIFSNKTARQIEVTVKAGANHVKGEVMLKLPEGWSAAPEKHSYTFESKEDEQSFVFEVSPPAGQSQGEMEAVVTCNGQVYNYSINTIAYDHIKTQVLMPKAQARVVKLDINRYGDKIGYIEGAGDVIPTALREVGYEVWEMKNDEVTPENLAGLDAVVVGVRALNTNERLPYFMDNLLEYVHNGGTLVFQYNNSYNMKTKDFAPYPITLSHDRVTDEHAKMKILAPDHPVVNEPNKITQADFEGWVQERGLYFPNKWDSHYEPILSSHDKGESALKGGLLVAKFGKGYYVYSGYSWFRELPAGVPGAFRLFVNLVSLGNKPDKSASSK